MEIDAATGRVPSEPGSREPSPAVSALTGFDPSRVRWIASKLSASARRNLNALPVSGSWATISEMKPEATGSGMTLLYVQWRERLCEREWTQWGGELGQKRGEGYQYRITAFGRAVRAALRDRDGSAEGNSPVPKADAHG